MDDHPNAEQWRFIDNEPGERKAHPYKLGQALQQVWGEQADFNRLVKGFQTGVTDWLGTYLLGMLGSSKEVLETVGWKKHERHQASINRENLASDLADVTKYLLSAWQEFGFTEMEFLEALQSRSEIVRTRFTQQIFSPEHKRIIVTDLDGTGADFRTGFARFLGVSDTAGSLSMDVDLGIPYNQYAVSKDSFEMGGGYGTLPVYADWLALVKAEQRTGAAIFVATARPIERFKRIANDTVDWLNDQDLHPDTLLFGRDERVLALLEMAGSNEVLLLEDDPALALRAANAGIFVWLRAQPYNGAVRHPMVERWTSFPEFVPWDVISKWREQYAASKTAA